jgi:hypothetical protein
MWRVFSPPVYPDQRAKLEINGGVSNGGETRSRR